MITVLSPIFMLSSRVGFVPGPPLPVSHVKYRANQCALQVVVSVCHAFTQSFPLQQVARESGPPHMKSFVTKVSVGEFVGEGEGKSKKISKKNAAIAVLEELKKLPPLPAVERVKPRIKKKTKPIVRVSTLLGAEGVSVAGDRRGAEKTGCWLQWSGGS